MQRSRVVLVVVVATSTLAHAQVSREDVDAAFAKSIAVSHACGGHYRAVYDWKSYDALDWAHHDKSKEEQLEFELSNVEIIGSGLDDACDDQNCKAALAQVDTIIYRAAEDESRYAINAQISGHTVTFANHVFGSSRNGPNYSDALKRACKKPSSKWDATYAADSVLASANTALCRPSSATALKVAHGKFSVPWYALDWTREESAAKSVAVGHVDGVVHDDGTTSIAMVLDDRPLAGRDARTVRVKRALDAVQSASMTFKVVDQDKEAQLALEVDGVQCEIGWSIRAPRIAKAAKAAKPAKDAEPSKAAGNDDVVYGHGVKWSESRMNEVDAFEPNKDSWDHGSIRKRRGNMRIGQITTAYRCDDRNGCQDQNTGWTAIGYFLQPW